MHHLQFFADFCHSLTTLKDGSFIHWTSCVLARAASSRSPVLEGRYNRAASPGHTNGIQSFIFLCHTTSYHEWSGISGLKGWLHMLSFNIKVQWRWCSLKIYLIWLLTDYTLTWMDWNVYMQPHQRIGSLMLECTKRINMTWYTMALLIAYWTLWLPSSVQYGALSLLLLIYFGIPHRFWSSLDAKLCQYGS